MEPSTNGHVLDRLSWIGTELRQTARRLGRSALFTGIILLTVAIEIGATVAMSIVVNRVLIQPLRDSKRLVSVWQTASSPGVKKPHASSFQFIAKAPHALV